MINTLLCYMLGSIHISLPIKTHTIIFHQQNRYRRMAIVNWKYITCKPILTMQHVKYKILHATDKHLQDTSCNWQTLSKMENQVNGFSNAVNWLKTYHGFTRHHSQFKKEKWLQSYPTSQLLDNKLANITNGRENCKVCTNMCIVRLIFI